MGIPLRVLAIEDSEDDLALLIRELNRGGFEPVYERVETTEGMLEAMKKQGWDIVIADYVLPKFSGLQALKILRESSLDLPFILVSGMIGEETAVEAMRAGAHDYLLKYNFTRLISVINRELQEADSRRKRRQADEALRISEQQYRRIVETSAEGIWTIDANDTITFVNQKMADMLGFSASEMTSRPITDFMSLDVQKMMVKALHANNDDKREPLDTIFLRKDGTAIWVIISFSPMLDDKGNYLGALGMMTDITTRKKLEKYNEARLTLSDDLQASNDIADCLKSGCNAIGVSGLTNRAVMVLMNENKQVEDFGSLGLKERELSARKAVLLDSLNGINLDKFKKSESYLLPGHEADKIKGTIIHISADLAKEDCKETANRTLLLVPIKTEGESQNGWFSIDIPRPHDMIDDEAVIFAEEISDMVSIRMRELQYFEQLVQERRALQEKNIALREVLATIEAEKMEIRKQIANMIDDVLRPAMNKLLRKNGSINMTYYQLLKANLDELAATTGQVLPMSSKLSPRELEICALIKNGASSKDIADALGIALVTVQKHREVIRKKLGLTNQNVNLVTHLRNV